MSILFSSRGKSPLNATAPAAVHPMHLARTFVETGDERCPLAGIWSRLSDTDSTADDPELPWPAMWMLLPWRAFHPALTTLR
jgi:hypothetical protein